MHFQLLTKKERKLVGAHFWWLWQKVKKIIADYLQGRYKTLYFSLSYVIITSSVCPSYGRIVMKKITMKNRSFFFTSLEKNTLTMFILFKYIFQKLYLVELIFSFFSYPTEKELSMSMIKYTLLTIGHNTRSK